jgi:hypothetical protein
VPIGLLGTNQIARVAYNVASGAYWLLDLDYSSVQAVSGVSVVGFPDIPAGINHLECDFALSPSANGGVFGLQVYGAGGVLDTTAANQFCTINTGAGGVISNTGFSTTLPLNTNTVDNGNAGLKAGFGAQNIQAAEYTAFNFRAAYHRPATA